MGVFEGPVFLDDDPTLAANSDSLGVTEKAVKAYIDAATAPLETKNAAANSFRGNNTGSVAPVKDLTVAQAKTLLGLGTAATHASTDFDAAGAAATAQATAEAYTDTAVAIDGLTAKTTPVDADETVIADSAASFARKKLTWANVKAALNTYFATIFAPIIEPVNPDATAARTISHADVGAQILFSSGSAITLTFPQDTDAPDILIGMGGTVSTTGAGQATFAQGTGAVVHVQGGATATKENYGVARWKKIAANTYQVSGDVA